MKGKGLFTITRSSCLGGFCLIASPIREAGRVVDSSSQCAVVRAGFADLITMTREDRPLFKVSIETSTGNG